MLIISVPFYYVSVSFETWASWAQEILAWRIMHSRREAVQGDQAGFRIQWACVRQIILRPMAQDSEFSRAPVCLSAKKSLMVTLQR